MPSASATQASSASATGDRRHSPVAAVPQPLNHEPLSPTVTAQCLSHCTTSHSVPTGLSLSTVYQPHWATRATQLSHSLGLSTVPQPLAASVPLQTASLSLSSLHRMRHWPRCLRCSQLQLQATVPSVAPQVQPSCSPLYRTTRRCTSATAPLRPPHSLIDTRSALNFSRNHLNSAAAVLFSQDQSTTQQPQPRSLVHTFPQRSNPIPPPCTLGSRVPRGEATQCVAAWPAAASSATASSAASASRRPQLPVALLAGSHCALAVCGAMWRMKMVLLSHT